MFRCGTKYSSRIEGRIKVRIVGVFEGIIKGRIVGVIEGIIKGRIVGIIEGKIICKIQASNYGCQRAATSA